MSSEEPQDGYLGPSPTLQRDVEPDNCIKILLATDNHIGYAENDPVRGRDSINTFREILQLAVANDVDMLLLAGDLFHENRPSRTALYQTMAALREFTMGPRPVSLEIVSEAGIGIKRDATWPAINYEDENINVGLPIFSIHGNHDDPQGTGSEGALCALDLLSASGLINYFGRMELPGGLEGDEEVLGNGLQVKPVLLQKGSTKLAMYGMGNIRDERFHYEMKNHRIQMFKPSEHPDEWFNVILVHQNRVAHGPGRNVVDTAFGDEAHLVVWGHEHDCIERATPQPVTGRPYYIVQPGSSIATSLAKGESIPKHVSLVKIQGKEFQFEPIRLRSVRPFIFEEISLMKVMNDDENVDLSSKIAVTKFLKARVRQLIARANKEWDDLHADDEQPQERLLPLIRIRVDYSGGPEGTTQFEIGNPQRFGQDFVDKVANPRDIVQFHRRSTVRAKKVEIDQPDSAAIDIQDGDDLEERLEKLKVSTLVAEYLAAQNLSVLPEDAMQLAVEQFVDKQETTAISALIKKCLKHSLNTIVSSNFEPGKGGPELDVLDDELAAAKKSTEDRLAKEDKRDGAGGAGKKGKGRANDHDDEDDEMLGHSEDDRDSMVSERSSETGPSRGGKSSKKAPSTTTTNAPSKKTGAAQEKSVAKPAAAKGRSQNLFNAGDDDDEDELVVLDVDDDSDDDVSVASSSRRKAPAKKKAVPAASTRKTPAVTKKTPARTTAKKAAAAVSATMVSSESGTDSSAAEVSVRGPSKKRKR